MAIVTDVVAKLRTDATGFNSGFKDASRSVDNFQRSVDGGIGKAGAMAGVMRGIGTAAAVAGGALAAAGIVQLGQKAVASASNLAETTSKVGVIFGDAKNQIVDWSKTASKGFGQSQQQAMDAASTFAAFGKSANLSGGDLAGFATGLTELASDLASFYNTTPQDAIFAIGAALRGETEPIRRYNILLDDASLRQEAFAKGITDGVDKALTPQQKVLAAQALIMKQSSDAQGDFQRTSDGLANSQRTLTATIEDLYAQVGAGLLPAVTEITQALGPFLQQLAGPLTKVATLVGEVMADAFEKLTPLMTPLATLLSKIIELMGSNLQAVLTSLIPVVIPVVNIFIRLVSQILPTITPLITKLVAVFGALMQALLPLLPPLADLVLVIFKGAGPILDLVAGLLLDLVTALTPVIAAVSQLLPPITQLIQVVFAALQPILNALMPVLGILADVLGFVLVKAVGLIMQALGRLIQGFGIVGPFVLREVTIPVVRGFVQMADGILKAAESALGWVPGWGDKIGAARESFNGWAAGIETSILSAADTVSTEATRIGQEMVDNGTKMLYESGPPTAAGSAFGMSIATAIGMTADQAWAAGMNIGVAAQNGLLSSGLNDRLKQFFGLDKAPPPPVEAPKPPETGKGETAAERAARLEAERVRKLSKNAAFLEAYPARVAKAILGQNKAVAAAGREVAAAIDAVKEADRAIKSAETLQDRIDAELALTDAIEARKVAVDALADAEKNVGKASKEAVQAAAYMGAQALQRLKDTARQAIDLIKQMRDSTADFAAITSIDAPAGARPSARAYLANMQDKLSRIRDFGAALTQLSGLGLPGPILEDIFRAGPDAGLKIAQALLAETSTIADFKTAQADINAAALGVANVVGASLTGYTAESARSVIDTQVNINLGERSVYIEFAPGVTAADKAQIQTVVDTAVERALERARREAARR